MSYEVEVKFRVPDPSSLTERLQAIGAEGGPTVSQADLYLAHPSRDFAQTDEALRLRQDGSRNYITYKGPKRGGPTKTREEIEIPYESGDDARKQLGRLFERLGFRPVADVRKYRQPFYLRFENRDLTIVLDQAEGLGSYAEVEAIAADDADLPAAQGAVLALGRELGLIEVEPRSYLRMTLERRGGIGPDSPGST